jgi:MarR family transcriptional regulator, 2-MHQ and catechol-resistance regulon repressor
MNARILPPRSGARAARPAKRPAEAPVDARYADDLKLWVVLARAHAAVEERVSRNIAEQGMSIAEFGVLELLYHKGPQLLGDIQRRILVSSGGITFLVDRLEAKGLVAREACPDDRRARFAVLTAAGRALMKRIFPKHAQAVSRALSGLTRDERQAATKLLRALGLAAAGGEPGPGTG